jgi:hypothetical protein
LHAISQSRRELACRHLGTALIERDDVLVLAKCGQ